MLPPYAPRPPPTAPKIPPTAVPAPGIIEPIAAPAAAPPLAPARVPPKPPILPPIEPLNNSGTALNRASNPAPLVNLDKPPPTFDSTPDLATPLSILPMAPAEDATSAPAVATPATLPALPVAPPKPDITLILANSSIIVLTSFNIPRNFPTLLTAQIAAKVFANFAIASELAPINEIK